MFELDKNLKSLILENLPDDGMSISALSRILNERGVKIHRLELSGYLKALSDLNVLRERDIKPSKVFSPLPRQSNMGIHERIGQIVKRDYGDDDKRASIALFVLCRLFRRAIFEKELRLCGLTGTPSSRRCTAEEREEAVAAASRAGFKIPSSDLALVSTGNHSQAYNKIIAEILIDIGNLRQYVSGTKQRTLEEG